LFEGERAAGRVPDALRSGFHGDFVEDIEREIALESKVRRHPVAIRAKI